MANKLTDKMNVQQSLSLQSQQLETMVNSLDEAKAQRETQLNIKEEISRLTDIFNAYKESYEYMSLETASYVESIDEKTNGSLNQLLSNSTAIEQCVEETKENNENALDSLLQSSEDAVEVQQEQLIQSQNLVPQTTEDTMAVGFPEFDESVHNGFTEMAKANEAQIVVEDKASGKLDKIIDKMDGIIENQDELSKEKEVPITSDLNKPAIKDDKDKNKNGEKKKDKKVDWIGGIGKILKKVLDPVALVGAFFIKILPYVIIAFAIIQGVFEALPAHLKVLFVTGITAMVGGIISIWALRTVGFRTLQAVIAGIFSTESGKRTMMDMARNLKEIGFAMASHLAQLATEMLKRSLAMLEKAFTYACRLMEVAMASAGWLIIAGVALLAVLAIVALATVAIGLIILAITALIGGIIWLIKETLSAFLKLMKFFFSSDDGDSEKKQETKMDTSWSKFTGELINTLDEIKKSVQGIAKNMGAPIEIKTKNLQEVNKQTIEKIEKPTLSPNDRYNYINNNAYTENETIRQQGTEKDEIGVKNAPNNDEVVSILNKIYKRLENLGGEDFVI